MRKILFALAMIFLAAPAVVPAYAASGSVPAPAADDHILGNPKAPITIFEYASLTCPHCAEFDSETLPKIKSAWIDPGKARLIFRDYPLDQAALRAAVVAHCAAPDRFFGFIDALFQSQENWALSSDINGALEKIARLGGISADQFKKCMADQTLADKIVAERLVAQDQYGVDSTPTFFINGQKLVGAQPYDEFNKILTADAGGASAAAPAPSPAPAASTPATGAATPAPTTSVPATSAPATPVAPAAPVTPAPTHGSITPLPSLGSAAPLPAAGWMQGMVAEARQLFGRL